MPKGVVQLPSRKFVLTHKAADRAESICRENRFKHVRDGIIHLYVSLDESDTLASILRENCIKYSVMNGGNREFPKQSHQASLLAS